MGKARSGLWARSWCGIYVDGGREKRLSPPNLFPGLLSQFVNKSVMFCQTEMMAAHARKPRDVRGKEFGIVKNESVSVVK